MTRISFAIGTAVAALGTMQAMAADLGRFPPAGPFYPPPPVVRVYNWTGCYLGAQLGGAFANNQLNGQTTVPVQDAGAIPPVPAMTTSIDQNSGSTAVIAGGQGGCDLQFARNWVIGAQLDGAWTHLSGSQGVAASQGIANQGTNSLAATLAGKCQYHCNCDWSHRLRYQFRLASQDCSTSRGGRIRELQYVQYQWSSHDSNLPPWIF